MFLDVKQEWEVEGGQGCGHISSKMKDWAEPISSFLLDPSVCSIFPSVLSKFKFPLFLRCYLSWAPCMALMPILQMAVVGRALPRWLSGKRICLQCRRHMKCGFNCWIRRSPGGGHDNPLQYSCRENPMDRGAWWVTVDGVAKSWTHDWSG